MTNDEKEMSISDQEIEAYAEQIVGSLHMNSPEKINAALNHLTPCEILKIGSELVGAMRRQRAAKLSKH
jgi:hypothetical protein